MESLQPIFQQVKEASRKLPYFTDAERSQVLQDVAQAIEDNTPKLLEANKADLQNMDPESPMYDRLMLTEARLSDIAADMRHVATLPSPLNRVLKERTLPNGLHLRRVSVPFGVIGMIYEARPNVTFDVFSLCLKSGNACVLKGGKDAQKSNEAAVNLIHEVLREHGMSPMTVALLPANHESTAEMLNAVGYIDLCIPRGGRRLIDFVRQNAHIPVIETGAGVVHCFVDKDADLDIARRVIENAKCRRVSVCNALDTLLIHSGRLADLPSIVEPLRAKGVRIHADERAYEVLSRSGYQPLETADSDTYHTEWLSLQLSVRTVDSLDEALRHIASYGSGHSECIITSNDATAEQFRQAVDAACVYVNASTAFTDGGQFGLGAEIGISTQKLGARGPMALEEITTYKWLIDGNGQVRP